jgi:hypothetical protein
MTLLPALKSPETADFLVGDLNAPTAAQRLAALRQLVDSESTPPPANPADVNNHIHTFYSFSPYSPTLAVWKARAAGLCAAGLIDHDSLAGGEEFLQAGEIAGLPVTIGVECRADFSRTRLQGRRINNPDQISIGYVALHGVPRSRIQTVRQFFAPLIEKRQERNRAMTAQLNLLLSSFPFSLNYDRDVLPFSRAADGGTVTERHLLFALAQKLVSRYGRGPNLAAFVQNSLHIPLDRQQMTCLLDADNPHYAYDLLGSLKSSLVPQFYRDAADECPDIRDLATFAAENGIILAYAYLGDVEQSVTGDKKPRKFEDDYLDLLFEELAGLRFQAVTYMPSRNTPAQLRRVQNLCRQYGFMEISGEDINSPRQAFVCPALRRPEFKHLCQAAWALIAHQKADGRGRK